MRYRLCTMIDRGDNEGKEKSNRQERRQAHRKKRIEKLDRMENDRKSPGERATEE